MKRKSQLITRWKFPSLNNKKNFLSIKRKCEETRLSFWRKKNCFFFEGPRTLFLLFANFLGGGVGVILRRYLSHPRLQFSAKSCLFWKNVFNCILRQFAYAYLLITFSLLDFLAGQCCKSHRDRIKTKILKQWSINIHRVRSATRGGYPLAPRISQVSISLQICLVRRHVKHQSGKQENHWLCSFFFFLSFAWGIFVAVSSHFHTLSNVDRACNATTSSYSKSTSPKNEHKFHSVGNIFWISHQSFGLVQRPTICWWDKSRGKLNFLRDSALEVTTHDYRLRKNCIRSSIITIANEMAGK